MQCLSATTPKAAPAFHDGPPVIQTAAGQPAHQGRLPPPGKTYFGVLRPSWGCQETRGYGKTASQDLNPQTALVALTGR